MFDGTTEWGKHAEQRLQSNCIAWLTTVGGDGRPYTVPIGFLWEGQTVLIFSQPHKLKLRNIRNNPRVTLALDETNRGHDVVIVEGTAQLIDDPQISVKLPAYVEKYAALIQSRGWTPEAMAADYSQAIRVTPTKITVHVVPSRRLSSGLQTEPVLTQFFSHRCKKGRLVLVAPGRNNQGAVWKGIVSDCVENSPFLLVNSRDTWNG